MRYFTIQEFMITHLKLSGNELLVYAIIFGFSQDGASLFFGSYNYIAGWLNCSQRVVINTIKKLEKKGLIEKIVDGKNGNKYKITDKYKTITSEKNSEVKTTISEKNSEVTSEQNSEGSEKNSDNNNIYNYNNINNNINIITPEGADNDFSENNYSYSETEEKKEKEKSSAKKEKENKSREDINNLISEIKFTLEQEGLNYVPDKMERNYAKHLLDTKAIREVAEKYNMSSYDFAVNVLKLALADDFWRTCIGNCKDIYYKYGKIINKMQVKLEQSRPKYNLNLNEI